LDNLFKAYGKFVAKRAEIVILVILLFTLLSIYGMTKLQVGGGGYSSLFPKDEEVIRTMNIVRDEFGGADSLMIVIEIDEGSDNKNAIMDIRDPRVIRYAETLEHACGKLDKVIGVQSVADILRAENNGNLPNSLATTKSILEKSPLASQFVSSDYKTMLIRISLADVEGIEEEITDEVQKTIDEYPPPLGIKVALTGMPAITKTIRAQIKPDMKRTSRISFMAIFIIVLLLFRSLKYGLLPLLGVALGTIWTNGTLGLLGIKIKPVTSGATSMVLGIGIDFGIQVVNRFRLELEGVFGEKLEPEEAITETLARVIKPMGTTTLAALIGFRAMNLGRLTVMKDLGNMMCLGIVMCMLSALTLIPSLLIITEKMKRRRRSKK